MYATLLVNALVFFLYGILPHFPSISVEAYFGTTLFLIAICGICTGLLQNSMFGFAAEYAPIYIQGITLGQGFAGVITSIVYVVTLFTTSTSGKRDPQDII